MFSLSQGSGSVRSISSCTNRYRKPRASLLTQNCSSLDKLRAENMARNEQKFKELGFVTEKEQKLSVFRKRVVPKRTGSTKYVCVAGCSDVATNVDSFLAHLQSAHKLVMKTENLAPLGLGVCAFCNGVFAALRGMSVHLKSCTHPRALLSELVEGPFPRTCRVWWAGENTWYEGLASPSRDVENCWQVTYSNGEIENEFCHVVIFDTPAPVVHSEISLRVFISDLD